MSNDISLSVAQTTSPSQPKTNKTTIELHDNVQDVVMSDVDDIRPVNNLTKEQIKSIARKDNDMDHVVGLDDKGLETNNIKKKKKKKKKDSQKGKHEDEGPQDITNGHNGTENNNGELKSSSAEATSSPPTTKETAAMESERIDETRPNEVAAVKQSKKQKKKEKQNSSTKAEERMRLSNPDKIVETVLEKSTFKIPNLSQIVSEQLYAPDFEVNLCTYLKSIRYKNTVGDGPIGISVLPSNFDPLKYKVNVNPSAITSLGCIYEKPERRIRGRAKKGKNRKGAKNRNDAGSAVGQGKDRGRDKHRDGQSKRDEPQKGSKSHPKPMETS